MKEQLIETGVPTEDMFAERNEADNPNDRSEQSTDKAFSSRRFLVQNEEQRDRCEHQAKAGVCLHRNERGIDSFQILVVEDPAEQTSSANTKRHHQQADRVSPAAPQSCMFIE